MKQGNKVEANFIQIALILLSILLSLTLAGILLYACFKKAKNRVLLFLSVGILMHAVTSAAYYTRELWLGILSYALFTTLILHATAKYLKTKGKTPSCELFAFIIPLFAVYFILLTRMFPNDKYLLSHAVFGFFGFVLLAIGANFMKLKAIDKHHAYLGISAAGMGGLMILHPLLFLPSFQKPANFAVWATAYGAFGILLVFSTLNLVLTKHFVMSETPLPIVELKRQIQLITPKQYEVVKENLKDFPVLAFVRSLKVPEKWIAHYVSTTPSEKSIPPTNLAYMAQLASDYLRSLQEKGSGVVLIDCPEYLAIYNGFEALVKFLASLRDMALIHGGNLLVVVEENAFEPQQAKVLKRALGT